MEVSSLKEQRERGHQVTIDDVIRKLQDIRALYGNIPLRVMRCNCNKKGLPHSTEWFHEAFVEAMEVWIESSDCAAVLICADTALGGRLQ